MAVIPDATAFGARPVPQSGRQIASAPNGGEGEALQRLGQAGVSAVRNIQNEQERQGRLAEAEREKEAAKRGLLEEAQAKSFLLQSQSEAFAALDKDPDYAKYEDKYKVGMASAVDEAAKLFTDPYRKAMFLEDAAQMNTRGVDEVRRLMKGKETDAGKANLIGQVDMLVNSAASDPDPDRARIKMSVVGDHLKAAVGLGWITAVEAQKFGADAGENFQLASFMKLPPGEQVKILKGEGAQSQEAIPVLPLKDYNTIRVIAMLESSGNPNAVNKDTGAAGLVQFMPGTAADVGVSDPLDPVQALEGAQRLIDRDRPGLAKAIGREPRPEEIYLMVQQGGGGAAALLRNPEENAVTALAKAYHREKNPEAAAAAAVRQNGGNEDMTAGEFAGMWAERYRRMEATGVAVPINAGGPLSKVPFNKRLQLLERTENEIERERKLFLSDPAGVAVTQGAADAESVWKYQASQGLPEVYRRVLPNEKAKLIAAQLNEPADPAAPYAALNALKAETGKMYGKALQDLQREGLTKQAKFRTYFDPEDGRDAAAIDMFEFAAKAGRKELEAAVPKDDRESAEADVTSDLADFQEAMLGEGALIPDIEDIKQGALDIALAARYKGRTSEDAASLATDWITSKYATREYNGRMYRVPAKYDADAIEEAVDFISEKLEPVPLNGVPNKWAKDSLTFSMNSKGTGLVARYGLDNNAIAMDRSGRPIEFTFSELAMAWRDESRRRQKESDAKLAAEPPMGD